MIGTREEHLIDEYEGQGITPEFHARRITDMARTFAADPRFAHLGKSAEWWQATLDQEERVKSDSAHLRRSL